MENRFLPFYENTKKENAANRNYFYILSDALCAYYINLWNSSSDKSDSLKNIEFSDYTKNINKIDVEDFLRNLVISCYKIDKNSGDERVKEEFREMAFSFINNSIFFNTRITNNYPIEFISSTRLFVEKSKAFDESFNFYDIFQALRNVWTMNVLQSIFSKEVALSPAVFGYSMLYPYTDNFLDNKNIDLTEKRFISTRLKNRLSGNQLIPLTSYEEKVFKLITDIEDFFPRQYHYGLFNSLSYIHYFQTKSLTQQSRKCKHSADNIQELTFKKGGMSVLADAYLVKGNLNMNEIIFSFGLGVILQMLDDLQDINMDMRDNNETIFTMAANCGNIDSVTIKMLNFIDMITSSVINFDSTLALEIKKALSNNCTLMVLFSISRNRPLLSKDFVSRIEQCYPLPPSYMKGFNKRLQRIYYKLKKLKSLKAEDIFDILLDK